MITISRTKLYPYIIKTSIAYPSNEDKTYNIVVFPENVNFMDVYQSLDIKRIFVRKVFTPLSPVLRLYRSKALFDTYRQQKLIPIYSIDKERDSIITDASYILNAVERRYGKAKYRRKNIIEYVNNLVEQYKTPDKNNVLLYIIDLNKPFEDSIFDRRSYPFLFNMQYNKTLPYDYFLICVIKDSIPFYFLIKNPTQGTLIFGRIRNIFLQMKPILEVKKPEIELATEKVADEINDTKTEESAEQNTSSKQSSTPYEQTSNIVVHPYHQQNIPILPQHILNYEKIKSAVQSYLKDKPEVVEKINSNQLVKNDLYAIATKSIVRNTYPALHKNIETVNLSGNTEEENQKLYAKVRERLLPQVVRRDPPQNNYNDPVMKRVDIPKLNENKEPSHILNKRKEDFSEYFTQDLKNAFTVLANKEPPLKMKSMKITNVPIESGDLEPSALVNYKIELVDNLKKVHEVNIQVPKIMPDGTFYINGEKKYLIYQIILDPIFFLKKGLAKFESMYATMSFHLKETRHKSYFMLYIGGLKLPLADVLGYYYGFDNMCGLYNIKYKVVDKLVNKTDYQIKLADNKYIIFKYESQAGFLLLESIKQNLIPLSSTNFKDPNYYKENILKISGNRNSIFTIDQVIQNILDPITLDILKSKREPTTILNICLYICDELAKGRIDDRNDINNQRIRSSEVFVQQIHNLMLGAYNEYKFKRLAGNKDASYILDTTQVVKEIVNSQLVRSMENINPLEELSALSKTTYTGPGGIPDAHAMTRESRNIHSSFYGQIDSMDTPENCLEKNEKIRINQNKNEKICNLVVGDKILWVDNKLYDIVNKQFRKKEKIIIKTKIGNIGCSKDHKFPVFDIIEKSEKLLKVSDIIKDSKRYKFIKMENENE
jgi:hypothetical protein